MSETGESLDSLTPINPSEQKANSGSVSQQDAAKAFVSMLSGLETTLSGTTQFNPEKVVKMHSADQVRDPALNKLYEQIGGLASETNKRVMDARGIPQAQTVLPTKSETNTPKQSFWGKMFGKFKK